MLYSVRRRNDTTFKIKQMYVNAVMDFLHNCERWKPSCLINTKMYKFTSIHANML